MSTRIPLFGYEVDAVSPPEAVEVVAGWVAAGDGACRYVVTPNVHHTVMYQRNEALRAAYADAGLVLADGAPVVLAARLLGRPLPGRVTGSDLVPALFDRFREEGLRVYLLGAGLGVAARAAERIEACWPGVRVVGVLSPPPGFERDPDANAAILSDVAAARPDVLVVGLGAPKQELWVHRHRAAIRARAALCVGAAIDFLAGEKRRAPRWMQRSGLEWLHRMSTEPRRLFVRYAHDAFAFPPLVCREWLRRSRRTVRAAAATSPQAVPPAEVRG